MMSNETKWTKGPWRHALRNANEIMTTFHGVQIGRIYIDVTTDNEAGDAHLIAAAPDGAALAELAMDFCGNPKGLSEAQQDELYETALQFMKKARGETS